MKYYILFILLGTILFLSISCKKEIERTPVEAVRNEINQVIEKYGINKVLAETDKSRYYPYRPNPNIGITWEFSADYISIYMGESSRSNSPYEKWNLLYLDSYNIDDWVNTRILVLHFKDSALIVQ